MACFVLGDVMFDNDMIMSLKQKEINFIPRIKLLNHNMYLIEKNIVALKVLIKNDEASWYTFISTWEI